MHGTGAAETGAGEHGPVERTTDEHTTDEHTTDEHGAVTHDAGADSRIGHSAGGSDRAPSQSQADHAEHVDVMDAPIEQGSDPLSDDALDGRSSGPRRVQVAFFGVLAVLFAILLITDIAHHSWGRAGLGFVVLAVCCFALVRELRGGSRG